MLMPPNPNIGALRCQRVHLVDVEDTVTSETCFVREQRSRKENWIINTFVQKPATKLCSHLSIAW
jgi:hypothetical protein